MKASDYMFALWDKDGNVIGMGVKPTKYTMRVVGSSLRTSVLENEAVISATFHPFGDDEEVVAVCIYGPEQEEKNPKYVNHTFFVKITRNDDVGYAVDLGTLWVSPVGRIGQIVANGDSPYIRVRIGE